ncbi:hypothetical protein ONS95_010136 [Cadophora gregata]|uniref:uncharacterized protein n=1 Tax=Cadophora gregata TaxID=51156 RepID=UPI0026DD1076|nr:uncharacterized protein ONS95_010136 [Cadophora gregata]KAK0121857.1 hypothetical protein ONS95_010136 [Cadophora gregata]
MTDQQDMMERGVIGAHLDTDEIKVIVTEDLSPKSAEKDCYHGTNYAISNPAVKPQSSSLWRFWKSGKSVSNEGQAEDQMQDELESPTYIGGFIVRNYEMRRLELKLDILDEEHSMNNPNILTSTSSDDAASQAQKEILAQLEVVFNEYVTLLTKSRELTSFGCPSREDFEELYAFFKSDKPVIPTEVYIRHVEDLMSLKTKEKESWLETRLWNVLRNNNQSAFLRYLFSTSAQAKKSDPASGVVIWSRTRMNKFNLCVILTMILIHFVAPVYSLWYMARKKQTNSSTAVSVAVLLVFTCTLTAVLSQFTTAKRHELLSSAAAYCAVLVVFIGNAGQSTGGGKS